MVIRELFTSNIAYSHKNIVILYKTKKESYVIQGYNRQLQVVCRRNGI